MRLLLVGDSLHLTLFSGARRHTTQAGKTATGSFAHTEPGRMCECAFKNV